MTRLLIFCCSALIAVALPRTAAAQAAGGVTFFENCDPKDLVIYLAMDPDQERPADKATLRGAVQIACKDLRLFANQVVLDGALIIATGDVVFSQNDLYVKADRAEINRQTRLGSFFNAAGVATLTNRPVDPNMFGTQEPQVMFRGARIERIGPRTYTVTDGAFSTCEQPTPRWEIVGSRATVVLDERVILRNAVLKVKDVPLLYLPFMYYPLGEDDRSTGFLIPSYSQSTLQGSGLSNAFFWAISRSQDAKLTHTWFSKGGQIYGTTYRFVSAPGSYGDMEFKLINEPMQVSTGGVISETGHKSFTIRGSANQALPRGFRAMGRVNYFTDLRAEQLYQQNIFRATQRERYFSGGLTGTIGRVRLSATAEQNDRFFGLDSAARHGVLPRVSLNLADKPIGRSRVYFGAGGEVAYLMQQDDLDRPETDQSLLRFDAMPTIRAPLSNLPWLSVSTAASWRLTYWLESLDETGQQVPVRLTRNLFDLQARAVGPVFSRVFPNANLKHLIEPEFNIRWLSPFERLAAVVRHDQIDTQVGGTTSLGYSLTNRFLVRRKATTEGGRSDIRQVLSVSLSQTYYSDQRAALFDQLYATPSAGRFSPLRFNVQARPAEDVAAQFDMEIDAEHRQPRSFSLSTTASRRAAQIQAGWTRRLVIPGLAGFEPDNSTNYITSSVAVRPGRGRVTARYDMHFDIKQRTMYQQRIIASYSAQCCGVNVDYQQISLTHYPNALQPVERRFGISFTLAGIGSFSNPLGSFGQ